MDINSNSNPNSNDHNNWLAFSLSNNSLFQPLFNTTTGVAVSNDQENGRCIANTAATDHHQLSSVLGVGGPKLEDFLGGSGVSSAGGGVAEPAADDVAQHHHHHQFSSDIEIYDDSELKNIAATFLRGFSNNNEQTTGETHDQWAVEVELAPPPEPPVKKAVETFSQRTSIYRGVTRWTGRYEAHLWDNSCRRQGQSRKGRQVYLGGYDKEEKAARAYDLAALKYWGPTTTTNFPVLDYEKEMDEMKKMTRQEFVASLRRKSSGFSRGASIYRGVTRHHQHGRWQARIGRVAGNKDLYLGTFSTQEEAAEAYDIAAIKFRGLNAVTNFDMSRYDVRSIASSNLPLGGVNNKSKTSSECLDNNKSCINPTTHGESNNINNVDQTSTSSISFPSCQNNPSMPSPTINFTLPTKQDQSSNFWATLGYQNPVTNSAKTTPPSLLLQDSTVPIHGATLHATNNTAITPFNMELQSNRFFNGGGNYYQEQFNGTGDHHSSPVSTNLTSNIAINGHNATSNGASVVLGDGNGSWVNNNPSLHLLQQPSKPNLSAFQRPIFGME